MGFLDFFRKKKTPEPEVELEEISFDEIGNWLDAKSKEFSEKEKKVFDLIDERIDLFVRENEVHLKVLREIDVEAKKVEERVKTIVKQGLDKYISYVDILIEGLRGVEGKNLSQFIKDVSKVFSNFEKHSYIFYERATYLIGDEIAVVKNEINNLSKYFTDLFSENQKLIDSLGLLFSVRKRLGKLEDIKLDFDSVSNEIVSLEKDVKSSEKKVKEFLGEIEKIKMSKDYTDNLKRCREIEKKEAGIESDLIKIKELIDFKFLSNVFHSDENKMKVIKKYKEDFSVAILEDSGKGILGLISETDLDNKIVLDKIKDVCKKRGEVVSEKEFIKKDEVEIFFKEIEKTRERVEKLKIEKSKLMKRKERIGRSIEEVEMEIKEGVGGLGGKVLLFEHFR